jgi:hypothetical protein
MRHGYEILADLETQAPLKEALAPAYKPEEEEEFVDVSDILEDDLEDLEEEA